MVSMYIHVHIYAFSLHKYRMVTTDGVNRLYCFSMKPWDAIIQLLCVCSHTVLCLVLEYIPVTSHALLHTHTLTQTHYAGHSVLLRSWAWGPWLSSGHARTIGPYSLCPPCWDERPWWQLHSVRRHSLGERKKGGKGKGMSWWAIGLHFDCPPCWNM